MRRSIQRTVAILFAITLAFGLVVCNVVSYRSVYQNRLSEDYEDARAVANLAMRMLDEVGFDNLAASDTSKEYWQMRQRLRAICQDLSLDYVSIYTVDSEEVRHYVIVVASDDNDDESMRTFRLLGATSDDELDFQERAALSGDEVDEPFEYENEFGKEIEWVKPYKDAQGEVVALIGVEVEQGVNTEIVMDQFRQVVVHFMMVLVVAFLAVFILMQRRVIVPIRTIAKNMRSFDPSKEPEPVKINTQDEMRDIADAFENMSRDIRTYIEENTAITTEREQVRAQMDVARRIQEGMVPASFCETVGGVDAAASMRPARMVGGDFYDCFMLDDGRYCALVGDVSGKGVAGALFMALTKSLLSDRLRSNPSPAEVLNQVNVELCAKNPEGMFATVFAFVLDPLTGEVLYANGGHNSPVILSAGNVRYLKPDPGELLGLFDDVCIQNGVITLARGEGLLLYTDGITEAVDVNRSFYGEERLVELLGSFKGAWQSGEVVDAVKRSVEDFSGGADQFDDITLVAVVRQGDGVELTLPASLEGFDQIKQTVLERAGDSPKAKKVVLACDEAFANIVRYSGASSALFGCMREGDLLVVTLRDNGAVFDPFAEGVSKDRDFEELDKGGMGIKLIRAMASEVQWFREGEENVLILKFEL